MYIVEACKQQNKRNVKEQMGEKYKRYKSKEMVCEEYRRYGLNCT